MADSNSKIDGFTVPSFIDKSAPEVPWIDVGLWEVVMVFIVFIVVTLFGRFLYRMLFK